MFHLVNSIYVNLDTQMHRVHPHFNLSIDTGYKLVYNNGSSDDKNISNQLGYSTSLDKLTTSEFKDWLRSMIAHKDGRMMIWVDAKNYGLLFATQLLAMDPSMSMEDFKFFLITGRLRFYKVRLPKLSSMDVVDQSLPLVDKIDQIYRTALKYSVVMRDIFYSTTGNWPLEWRIRHLVQTGECLGVRATVNNIQRRSLILSCVEALGEIQHLIGDPSKWDVLGCSTETLLGSDNIYSGMTSLQYLNSDWMLSANPYDAKVPMVEILNAAREALIVFEHAGDGYMLDRTRDNISSVESMLDGSKSTLEMVTVLFDGKEQGCRLSDAESSKYNEAMIRHFLRKG